MTWLIESLISKQTQSLVHLPQLISQLFHIFASLKAVFIVRWQDIGQDVLILLLDSIGDAQHLPIHGFHLFF